MPHTTVTTRAGVIILKATADKTTLEIAGLLGLQPRTVDRIYARAIEAGFDPALRPIVVLPEHCVDKPRSGRPTKQTPEIKAKSLIGYAMIDVEEKDRVLILLLILASAAGGYPR